MSLLLLSIIAALLSVNSSCYAVNCASTQADFRFRNDDGSETSATWQAAVNTNVTGSTVSKNTRLRIATDITIVTSGANNDNGKWQVSQNSGTYAGPIGTGTSPIKSVTSSNVTDQTATTQQISSGSYEAGCVTATGTCTASQPLSTGTYVENELIFQIVSGSVSNGDTLDFELYGICTNPTYTEIPRATVSLQSGGFFNILASLIGDYFYSPRSDEQMKLSWSYVKNI